MGKSLILKIAVPLMVSLTGASVLAKEQVVGVEFVKETKDSTYGVIHFLLVKMQMCKATYPSVTPVITKLTSDAAQIEMHITGSHCNDNRIYTFTVPYSDKEITDLGLDPASAKILVRFK